MTLSPHGLPASGAEPVSVTVLPPTVETVPSSGRASATGAKGAPGLPDRRRSVSAVSSSNTPSASVAMSLRDRSSCSSAGGGEERAVEVHHQPVARQVQHPQRRRPGQHPLGER